MDAMKFLGSAAALIALAASFMSDRRAREASRGVENLLAVSQLRACTILGVPPLPMVAHRVSTLATDGKTIFYNEAFIKNALASICQTPVCVEGLVLAMVAHEVAHAYCHPHAPPGHKIELEADLVAGYVLGRVGLQPDDFVTILQTFRATMFHPPATARAEQVRRGFARGTAERATAGRTEV